MSATVYTIGVPAGPSGWTIPDQVHTQLRLAHNLREDLVTAELDYEQAVKEVWSSYPRVAQVEWLLAEADYQAARLDEQVCGERSRRRTKRLTGPLPEQLKTQRAEVERLRRCRRDEISAVSDDAKTRLADLLDQLETRRKQLYAEHCQSGDLYWATFNFVVKAHVKAVKRIAALRKEGRPAELRHHRFDGTGTLAVQLQRQAGKPARTPAVIADPDGRYHNFLTIPWTDPQVWETMTRAEQCHAGRGTVRMRCGSRDGHPHWVDIPVQAHRMLPADADITGATLTITRIADRYRARLAVTAYVPEPPPVGKGPTVAVHIGWRNTGAGIQVAAWRSSRPLDIPAEWGHVISADPGQRVGVIVLPDYVGERIDRVDRLQSARDRDLDRIRARVVAWLDEHGPVPHPSHDGRELTAADVARWRAAARFEILARAWSAQPPTDADELARNLTVWQRRDRRRWRQQEHLRGRTLRHRNDMWRNIAAILAAQCGQVVLDDTPISSIARRSSDLPTDLAAAITRRRVIASPGGLRAAITSACTRAGVPIRTVSAAGLSRIHARCGHENPADDRYASPPVRCDGCGARYDPDRSATTLMLRRAKR